ncbi:MAG TPA: hypothetical protein IAC84_06590 [Firmicutes bacterium]|nr:hypothetical protein [Bacillota bacterium]
MYNHYQGNPEFIVLDAEPEDTRDQAQPEPQPAQAPTSGHSPVLGELTGSLGQLLGGLRKHFSLERLDTGDILLVLIILFLYLEGDNLELVITLGLMLLLGLGED